MSTFFDNNPDTMGSAAQYGPGFHDVSIRVSGSFVRDVPNWIGYLPSLITLGIALQDAGRTAQGIQALLNAKNWIVENVTDQSGWTGEYIFKIDAVVGNYYTDESVRQQIQLDLAELFVVSGATILSSNRPTQTPIGQTPATGGTVTQTPGAQNPGGSIFPSIPTTSIDAFAASLGVSTPIAIVGGAVLLAVLLRK